MLSDDFSYVWWGQVVSQVGDGVSKLALLWFVYSVTGSPLKTSIIGILQTAPAIVLAPIIGVAVDRLPKKALLIRLGSRAGGGDRANSLLDVGGQL